MFKLSLALWCGLIGSFFTFPGLRFARMHKDALKYCEERPFLKYVMCYFPYMFKYVYIAIIILDVKIWGGGELVKDILYLLECF